MKLLKRKNFQALIYAIFISLPMLSILPSTIYFAFNHEASNYTHEEVITTYEYETNEVNSVDDLVVGNIYHFDNTNGMSFTENDVLLMDKWFNIDIVSCNSANVASVSRDVPFIALYQTSCNFIWLSYSDSQYGVANNLLSFVGEFDFIYKSHEGNLPHITLISASDYLGEKNVEVIESEMNPLSAFDNAIGKFVSDNDFGNLDFFTFFSSLFLTSTSMNNLYIHFINWYMNYALYVSLAYLLFGVLLYFVNFFRKLVENSEDTHIGGF